jgi:RNA polymerase sigma factor (TIGR02999 family)
MERKDEQLSKGVSSDSVSELFALVYDELRHLAAVQLQNEKSEHTLQPTALVHEAYLRLVRPEATENKRFENKRHFFAFAAESMRRILIDKARAKQTIKRKRKRTEVDLECISSPPSSHDLLEVSEALDQLALQEPEVAELVKLRYFVGMTIPEAAVALEVSPRTADNWWAFARAWLLQFLESQDDSFPTSA